jgi:hypothetical protein
MKYYWPILLLLLVPVARSESVRVLSATCSPGFQFGGQGFAFREGGKTLVLAPADFVLISLVDSGTPICHSANAPLTLLRHFANAIEMVELKADAVAKDDIDSPNPEQERRGRGFPFFPMAGREAGPQQCR